MGKARLSFLCVLCVCGVTLGCATTRFARWDEAQSLVNSSDAKEAFELESAGDVLFSERKDLQKLEAALMKWELAQALAPQSRLLLKLAKGHYLCGERTQAVDDSMQKSFSHFLAGLGFAEKGIQQVAPQVVQTLRNGVLNPKTFALVPKEGAPFLYWYSMNLEKWALAQGVLTSLRYKGTVRAALVRALQFNDDVESYAQLSDTTKESKR